MYEGFGSDDAKVQKVGFLAVKHLEWRLHLERLMRSPVLEVRRRREQPPHIDRKPLSASMHLTMAHRILPMHSDTSICCGVLVAASFWITPIFKQYCRNSPPVYSPLLSAR